MNRLVALSIEKLEAALLDGNEEVTRMIAERASRNLQDLIGQASAVINGTDHVVDQAQIDALMEF
jgi:chromosomal replication initiation ATPase DnaA